MLPIIRPRRLRKTKWIRDLVAETKLHISDLIYPIFIAQGANIKEPIEKMPGICLYSIDTLLEEVQKSIDLGIPAISLFPQIDQKLKTQDAKYAYASDNLVCKATSAIKHKFSDQIGVICDVALDPYTPHGHDGLLRTDGKDVDNDATLEILAKQALRLAESGADFIAPSDMMDGRVRYIRAILDENKLFEVGIISYAAKYASKLYGPFRHAIKSATNSIDKSSYQMDVRNSQEAMREINLDIDESSDIILIKPAVSSLDIIAKAKENIKNPVFAYQVSGEYAMNYLYAKEYGTSFEDMIIESLTCIKRAGARGIFSYATPIMAKLLNN